MDLDPKAVVDRVLRFVEARGLFSPGVVVAAVSGGQDSVCMLDVLRRLQDLLGIRLHVAHLNHMFRGVQAEEEAGYVRDLAGRWGLPVTVAAIDVPGYRARHRLSKQVAARYARLQFLSAVAGQVGARQVAMGHTADDAVETLLMNLLRGSGLAGLCGMLPSRGMEPGQLGPGLESRDWRTEPLPPPRGELPLVVRPILNLFRSETEEYCRARGLSFRRDPSNLDMAYRRNWVRVELLPVLERHVPKARERLRNAADLLADDCALVADAVDRTWSELARVAQGRVEFGLESWGRLPPALRRHLLRRAMETLAGSLEGFGRAHVDACEALVARGPVGARVDLPAGLWLEKGYDSFWLAAGEAPPPGGVRVPEEPVPLPVPGVAVLPGATVEADLVDVVAEGALGGKVCGGGRWEACLDAARVGVDLQVRRRRPGDRFVPLGMGQPKKLHDFMVDEKIPRGERDRVPLVATPKDIVWVVGYRIDDRFKVTEDTRRVLRLRFRPEQPAVNDG